MLIAAPTEATAPTGAFITMRVAAWSLIDPARHPSTLPRGSHRRPSAIIANTPSRTSDLEPVRFLDTHVLTVSRLSLRTSPVRTAPGLSCTVHQQGRRPGSARPRSRARPAESTNEWLAGVVRNAMFNRAPPPPSAQLMACGSRHGPWSTPHPFRHRRSQNSNRPAPPRQCHGRGRCPRKTADITPAPGP